jgi:hypothetical protein
LPKKGCYKRYTTQVCVSSTSLNYYEPVEEWEVEENININVVEEIEENYL